MSLSHFQSEFEKLMNRDNFPEKNHSQRQEAFSKFLNTGIPTQKWEDWQFTNLTRIAKGEYRICETQDVPNNEIESPSFKMEGVNTIVIYNGHYQEKLSSIPSGVQILSSLDYLERKNWENNNPENSPFDLLNTAFMDSGVSIVVEPGTDLETPIRMLFISSGKEPIMTSPRVHLDLGESSSATFVEHHADNSESFFQNGSVFISMDDYAQLDHIRIQSNSEKTANMGNLHIEQNCNSRYIFFQFADGAELGRLNIHANLRGEGADCSLNGLALSNGNQHLDNHVITDHQVPNCTSTQNFKTVLQDNSSGVFNGRTIVRKDAQKTDSSQSNKNLLLSKNALMNSNPQLEIYADDVKCAHGSTTGALDKDALFYIRSRGFDILAAKTVLVRGFATELLESVKHDGMRYLLTDRFDTWLSENTAS